MLEQVRAQWKYIVAASILVVLAVGGMAAGVAVLAQGPDNEAARQPVTTPADAGAPANAGAQRESANAAQGAGTSPADAGVQQAAPTPRPPMGATYHTVQSGETLGAIAATYGLTSAAIANANGLANPNLIRVGQRLIIPAR